ncbi:MAG: hypothetical protein CVU19_03250 [Betaproteobacteria bacterium HGW-Betaproteobacteria-13]|jgi:hypothetical protein|uniref:Uncharacterized protein n=1 Tax=Parazoarcus communis TaxID=41977 RepID=A0A2U8H2M4_9RHOO|nr:hypothetical protein [Parazoarcus communis]AWI80192.1 hypothetical protein CEW87_12935 [Parazoarcus communis]PKO82160.1 MAG: hypothetical protein CVU19_03250 [Betaproteobacteria bacterium HGW-Betaproteobacteria-13]
MEHPALAVRADGELIVRDPSTRSSRRTDWRLGNKTRPTLTALRQSPYLKAPSSLQDCMQLADALPLAWHKWCFESRSFRPSGVPNA